MKCLKSSVERLEQTLKRLECDKGGLCIMKEKGDMLFFEIFALKMPAALILKQEALSLGAEFALPYYGILAEVKEIDGLLIITKRSLPILIDKLKMQPFGLKELANTLKQHMDPIVYEMPKIMGVINVTPDSFYDKSRFLGQDVIGRIEEMIEEGADVIDIGAASSRPGSDWVSEEEEIRRLKDVLAVIKREKIASRIPLSIDTYSPKVAALALDAGFSIVNDITGLQSEYMLDVVCEAQCEVVLMHLFKDPKHMQHNPQYDHVVLDIDRFFAEQIFALRERGIRKVILDVGIGFGKTLRHNLELITYLSHFRHHQLPLLVGASRKSLIDAIVPSKPEERLAGTLALHLEAFKNGAHMIRCHDVKEHKQAFMIQDMLRRYDA